MIKIEVQSTRAVIRSQEPLTVGLRGAKVHFTFGQDWESLTKTAVFRQADKTVAVTADPETVIPWEVLTMPGVPVQIGVYGVDSTGTVAIPTVWVVTQPVRPGADPDADPSAEPTPGLWEQMQGKLDTLETELKDVGAYVVTVAPNADGGYGADGDTDQIRRALDENRTVVCYWYDKDMMLHLTDFQSGVAYTFTAVAGGKEYCVVIPKSGAVVCTVTPLVTSVNGQTGAVIMPTAVKVTVIQNQDGSYEADRYGAELLEAHNAGYTVYCQLGNRVHPLLIASKAQMIFGCVQAGNVHSVTITMNSVSVTTTPLTSGSVSQEAVLYTPQILTDEQKAQARENLGIDQLLPGAANQETVLVNFTASEPVSLVDIPLSEEQVKSIINANIVSYRLTLFGDETAADTTGFGTAQLCYWCGWEASKLLAETQNAVPSAENRSWAVGNFNGFVIKSPAIENIDIGKHTNSKNKSVLMSISDSKVTTSSVNTLMLQRNIQMYLRLKTSLPIGTGSRMILTIR